MIKDNAVWLKNHDETEIPVLVRVKIFLSFTLMWVLLPSPSGWAEVSQKETERTAELLASLLDAGRVVVEQHQPLINDPRKGDKGFTPDVFERLVLAEFFRQSQVDLNTSTSLPPHTKDLLTQLLLASREVVADAQFVINQRGIGYKNFILATFGSQAARKFSKRSNVTIKQTTLDPRNLQNAPDLYEETVLKRLVRQPASTTPIIEWTDGGKLLRAMMPIYYSEDCLVCHGSPKGILDISGYPREGATVGELAGAISIQIPADHR
jgi:general secretion pathway protein A